MRSLKLILLAGTVVVLPSAANAALIGSLGGGGPFVSLTSAGLGTNGSIATLSGGRIQTEDQPFADNPEGTLFGGTFLAAGIRNGGDATLTFTTPTEYLSFLWGSPDTYNLLRVTTNVRSYDFTAQGLNFAVTDGTQTFSQRVQFVASAGETISSVAFNNTPADDAFEVANFAVTAVPEPATWAMMLVGFGMVGAASRYRRRSVRATFA